MKFKKYKLKDLVENFSVRARDYGGSEGLEFLGVSNDDGIVKSKSAAEHKGEEYKIIEKGCFAYNPYRINIGSIAYHNEDIKGLISPAYVIFKTKPNSIKDNLLFKFLKSAEGLRQIRFHGRGTVRQALRFEDLCKIEISLPSYEEQESLISNIEKTEFESNLISSELTHQLDLIKQLRQAFLREAMQGKLVDGSKLMVDGLETGHDLLAKIKTEKAKLIAEKKLKKEKELPPITADEIPFEIPEHWTWCRLGDLIFSMTNGIYKEEKYYNDDGIGCFRMYNIKDGVLNYEKLKRMILTDVELKTFGLESNDMLLNRVNSVELLGKAALVKDITENYVFESKNIRVRFFKKESIAPFINYLFQTNVIKDQILKAFTKVTGQASISQEKLSPLVIILPPLHEQEQIVTKLEELMAFCDGLEQSIKESQGYNEQLLQQVLREALQNS